MAGTEAPVSILVQETMYRWGFSSVPTYLLI